ncbi:hypothetical protein H0H92_014224 [Tricholoma furcatifolium]|nr:hypothetical protein H0H92_014224 [Tricholoma furcatifolium]
MSSQQDSRELRPDSPSLLHDKPRLPSSSMGTTRSPSPVSVSFRHRLSRPLDEDHPGLIGSRQAMRSSPPSRLRHPDSRRNSVQKTPTLDYSGTATNTPVKAPVPLIKPEPDLEDFTTALHPPPSMALDTVAIPSRHPSASPQQGSQSVNGPPDWPISVNDSQTQQLPRDEYPTQPISMKESQTQQPPITQPLSMDKLSASVPPSAVKPLVEMLTTASDTVAPSPAQPLPDLVECTTRGTTRVTSSEALPVVPQLSQPSHISDASDLSTVSRPRQVPDLWFAKRGHGQADIVDCEFEVDAETAHKCCIPPSHSTPESLDVKALSSAVEGVQTVWPEQGSLLVQMNPTKTHSRSWLPNHMGPDSPALDVTESVREGTNVLRLIQLDDMKNKVFILRAVLCPSDEQPTYWDVDPSELSAHWAAWNIKPPIVGA